jgi:penicillin-binding protein 1A
VAKKPARARKAKRHFLIRYWWLWAIPIGGAVITFGALAYVYAKLPLDLNIKAAQTSFLYDLDMNELTPLEQGVDRRELDFEKMPEIVRQAVIAAEDQDYYGHEGVDVLAIVRAAWANFTGGEIEQGGSTITQQYVRNVIPEVGKEQTISRKIKEVLLAIKLERRLEKDEILRRYLNTVYFGEGAYGIEAAAQTYFGVHAGRLELGQAATLAGLISGPELYDPVDNHDLALGRRDHVLDRMAELGFITNAEAAEEKAESEIETVPTRRSYERKPSAYFIDYARRELQRKFGRDLYTSGYKITGSLDPDWQEKAVAAVEGSLATGEEPGTPTAALVAIDVDTGEVRAMVGGRSFAQDQTNLATGDGGTGRQSGSAFKAFTLAAAIEQDISLNSTFSGPGSIDLEEECPGWDAVSNYGDSGQGTMNLVSATASSVNTIFAQLVIEVGPENVADIAHRMGIRSPLELSTGGVPCSITLGTLEVTPLEMTEAFATFASGGIRRTATPMHRVKGPNGRIVFDAEDRRGRRVIEENDALQAIYAMKQVVCCGTASSAISLPYESEVFGKTGSTDDAADAWFCGASTEVAACVWVGHPSGRVSMPGATGGGVAAPIWNAFMTSISGDIDPGEFEDPDLTGDILKGSPIAGPSPSPVEKKEKEEPKDFDETVKPSPIPTTPPPSPPPTTPPPSEPPPSPPPTTPPPPTPTKR